jgi:hypothetical protein
VGVVHPSLSLFLSSSHTLGVCRLWLLLTDWFVRVRRRAYRGRR